MERQKTEVEQLASQTIIGQTVEIDLGVRSWSNVAPEVSATALLYDDSWRMAFAKKQYQVTTTFQGGREEILAAMGTRRAKRMLAGVLAAAALMAAGFGLSRNGLTRERPVAVAAHPRAAIAAPTSAAAEVVRSQETPIDSNNELRREAVPAQEQRAASSGKAKEKSQDRSMEPGSPVATRQQAQVAVAPAPARSPSEHADLKRPLEFLPPPPLPTPRAQAPLYSSEKVEEKPLLAVDETKPQESGVSRPASGPGSPAREELAPTASNSRRAEPKLATEPTKVAVPVVVNDEVKRGPLPAYTVLALTASSVVVTDPRTRLPREFKVGSRLPSGEVVKSVDQISGIATTDKRSLHISD
jgi:hypothetical protein